MCAVLLVASALVGLPERPLLHDCSTERGARNCLPLVVLVVAQHQNVESGGMTYSAAQKLADEMHAMCANQTR